MVKKYIICVAALLGILIIWICCSNTIMGSVVSTNRSEEVSLDLNSLFNMPVNYAIDDMESLGDIYETIDIRGWAYINAKVDSTDRYVSIILSNGKRSYELKCRIPDDDFTYQEIVLRDDVASAFNLESENVGFVDTFSTFGISNGTYDAYIYCWEDENTYGIAHTGKMLQKKGSDVQLIPWQSSEADISLPDDLKQTNSSIDRLEAADDILAVEGWMFAEGMDCSTQNVYVSVNGKLFTTLPKNRADVAKAYGSELYSNSGYITNIPRENIPEGEFELQILLENDGVFYSGKSVRAERNGDSVSRVTEGNNTDNAEKDNASVSGSAADLSAYKTGTAENNSAIDAFNSADGSLWIEGWVYLADKDSANQKVYICIGDKLYPAEQVSRPDVGTGYKNELYNMSGFKATLPLDEIPEGESSFRIMVEQEGVLYECRTVNMTRCGNEVSKADSVQAPQTAFSSAADLSAFTVETTECNSAVDSVSANGDALVINGWVYLADRDCANQKVYISIGDKSYLSEQVSRPDVGTGFDNELYNMSGFKAALPLDEIPEGESSFTIIVEQDGVLYECRTEGLNRSGNEISKTGAVS